MKIGFTGTRKGMTDRQKQTFLLLLYNMPIKSFTHGGCHGADWDADKIVALSTPYDIEVRPGDRSQYNRYRGTGRTVYAPLPYLERNHKIVDGSDLLVATPSSLVEQQRSGTWATIRYARKVGKPTIILDP
jgi:hypothetical protein